MTKTIKDVPIRNSLLLFAIRHQLPHPRYSIDSFHVDKEALIKFVMQFIDAIDRPLEYMVSEKEATFNEIDVKLIEDSLTHKFESLVKKEYALLTRSGVPYSIRKKVLERDRWRCRYCGENLKTSSMLGFPPQVDHIKPRRSGGTHDPGNLVASCWRCNLGKKDYDKFTHS